MEKLAACRSFCLVSSKKLKLLHHKNGKKTKRETNGFHTEKLNGSAGFSVFWTASVNIKPLLTDPGQSSSSF